MLLLWAAHKTEWFWLTSDRDTDRPLGISPSPKFTDPASTCLSSLQRHHFQDLFNYSCCTYLFVYTHSILFSCIQSYQENSWAPQLWVYPQIPRYTPSNAYNYRINTRMFSIHKIERKGSNTYRLIITTLLIFFSLALVKKTCGSSLPLQRSVHSVDNFH